ncbi:MAG: C_GCAxxG_C_C family protein [Eubacterium sp.]|nr:C_GCAxxG_C_C family protein [Eubacterium sp.]
MKRNEIGKSYFLQGYNCAQAVVLAFKDVFDIEEEELVKLVSPLGGGMGKLREVCGAVSGMMIVIGQYYGYSDPKDAQTKAKLYATEQEAAKLFAEKNGSIVCRELLGLTRKQDSPVPEERTKEYYKKRPCADLVSDAVEVLIQVLGLKE